MNAENVRGKVGGELFNRRVRLTPTEPSVKFTLSRSGHQLYCGFRGSVTGSRHLNQETEDNYFK